MRQVNRTLLSASVFLAAALGASVSGAALAQAEDFVEAEAAEDSEAVEDAEEDGEGEFEDDASGMFDAAETPAEDTAEEPVEAQPADLAAPSGGAVLVVPGSTDESNPGGSTRPGTTPDD